MFKWTHRWFVLCFYFVEKLLLFFRYLKKARTKFTHGNWCKDNTKRAVEHDRGENFSFEGPSMSSRFIILVITTGPGGLSLQQFRKSMHFIYAFSIQTLINCRLTLYFSGARFGLWLAVSIQGAGPSHGTLCESGAGWCLCQEFTAGRGLTLRRRYYHYPEPNDWTRHHLQQLQPQWGFTWHFLREGDSQDGSQGTCSHVQ